MSAILFFQNREVPDSLIIINLDISFLSIRIYNFCIRIICTSLWDMVGGWDAAARGYHYDHYCTRPVIELLMWTGFLQLRAHCLWLGSSAVFRRMRFAVRCGAVRRCGGDILGRRRVAQVRTQRAARRKARDAQTCERSRARAYLGESLSEAIITAEKALPPLVQRTVPLNNNIGTSVICRSSPTFFR